METTAEIRYLGPALQMGRMDVYQAAENMLAFSEFMTAAVKTTYGEGATAKTEVSGFKQGSFLTSLYIQVTGQAATIFTALSAEQLWAVVKGAFTLWKFLKGHPPTHVQHHGNLCSVTNNSGQVVQIQTESLNLVYNEKAAGAALRFIGHGLQAEGYDGLEINCGNGLDQLYVNKNEAPCFQPVTKAQVISENRVRMVVHIVAAVFQEGNKWRFSDGERTFNAAIWDGDFLRQVNSGQRFDKGDLLDVDMQVVQNHEGLKTSLERSILKVHRHLTPQEQSALL